MLIPIEKQEFDYYRAMIQKTYEVRKLLDDKKVPLQKKVIKIKEVLSIMPINESYANDANR